MTDTPSLQLTGPTMSPRVRLADGVADELRNMILNGNLPAGTPLLQTRLAEQLGVSRTPLREAFRVLERDGLVRISNGNKTVEVIALDAGQLVETYEVRGVIDGLSARLAARRGLSTEHENGLRRSIADMNRACRSTVSIGDYGEAHAEFHLTVLHASGNSRLLDHAPLIRISSQMLLTRYLTQLQGPASSARLVKRIIREGNEDHRDIFDAIRDRDPVRAESAANGHIEKTTAFALGLSERSTAADRLQA